VTKPDNLIWASSSKLSSWFCRPAPGISRTAMPTYAFGLTPMHGLGDQDRLGLADTASLTLQSCIPPPLPREADSDACSLRVAWSLDRFTREGTLPTLQYLQRLDSYGVAYRSFTESWLDSLGPFKDVVLALLATLAKQERVRLSERVTAGLARARRERRIGGRPKVIVSTSKIRKLAGQGLSAVEIGAKLGCSRMTVARRLATT
jgi:hypothetical protein